MLPSGLLLLSSKLGYLLTGKFMDTKDDSNPDGHQLSACFVMSQMNQSVPELNLFTTADSVVIMSLNLRDMWSLDTIGICNPVHLNDDDRALEQFNNTISFDGNDITSLGCGRLICYSCLRICM